MIEKTVSYGRTFNLGNFESERIDLTVELEHDDYFERAVHELRQRVECMRKKVGEPKS